MAYLLILCIRIDRHLAVAIAVKLELTYHSLLKKGYHPFFYFLGRNINV